MGNGLGVEWVDSNGWSGWMVKWEELVGVVGVGGVHGVVEGGGLKYKQQEIIGFLAQWVQK